MTANNMLSKQQQQFASVFAAVTRLDPTVVAAWIRNEQPKLDKVNGNGDYNYLGIGIQSSSSKYGVSAPDWKDPISAGVLSGEWMLGAKSVPDARLPNGYTSAGSIRSIASTAGQSPDTQMTAIQASKWAAGGETSIRDIYKSMIAQGGFQPISFKDLVLPSGGFTSFLNPIGDAISGTGPIKTIDSAGNTTQSAVVGAYNGATSVADFLGNLVNKSLWIRIAEIVSGIIMAIAGAIVLGKEMTR